MKSKFLNAYLPRIVCVMLIALTLIAVVYLLASSPAEFKGLLPQVHT